jgi:hypothetical protein
VQPRIAILLSLLLAACGQDVRNVRLDEVDLSNMTVVQRLGQALGPQDRSAFTTFVAIHGRAAAGNCGLTLAGADSRAPETVGEAIQAMQIRLAQVQQAPAGADQPAIAGPAASAQLDGYAAPSLAEVNKRLDAIGR